MFSSGGYFRSVNCPFFVHGLCHRPYCHFRHARPGHSSTSKNSVVKSCLKSKATTNTNSGTEGSSSSKTVQISSNKESISAKPTSETQNTTTKNDTTSLESKKDEVAAKHPKEISDSKEEKKEKDSLPTPKKTSSILDSLNKLEQAVDEASASLLVHSNTKNLNTSGNSNSKVSTTCASLLKNSTSVNTTKNDPQTLENSNNLDDKTRNKGQEVSKDVQNGNKCKDISDATKCSETKEKSLSTKKISSDKEMPNINKEFEIQCEEVSNDSLEDFLETGNRSTLEEDVLPQRTEDHKEPTVLPKKRKSSDSVDVDIKRSKQKKHHLQVDSAKQQVKEVSSISKDLGNLEKSKTSSHKKDKNDDRNKQGSALKHQIKPKEELKILDIDFFSSPKKVKPNKPELKEKTKNKRELSNKERKAQKSETQTNKLHKNSDSKSSNKQKIKKAYLQEKKDSHRSKIQEKAKKNSSIALFESEEDEVRFSSDSFSGSDSETDAVDSSTEMLREIFDNYDPQKDSPTALSVTKRAKDTSSGISRQPSEIPSSAKGKHPSTVDLQGLGKKPRVAHNASYLVQRKSSNLNPVRRVPKTLASSSSRPPTQEQSVSKEYSLIQSKKRLAHQPKPASSSSIPRPRIPIEYGAKLPQSFRQRYLDKLIDEHLRLCSSEQVAFEKAVDEEKGLYSRSSKRHMYLNLCINAIKNLRSQPTPEIQSESTQSQVNTTTGTTAKHGISATLTSTKSSKKIDTDNLTEEMFYDLLSQYVLTEDELVENGFPRASPTIPGKVTFKPRKTQITPNKDPNRRTCCRCGTPYTVLDDGTYFRPEECVYHVGRLLRRRTAGEVTTTYSCCGSEGSTPGCAVGKVHVSEGKNITDGFMTTIVSPLAGNQKKVFAIDCEMCYTIAGLELTRATVVDWKLDKIYDTFVKPDNPVLDYNTRFSGVTEECLRGVKTSIREVQAVLLSMIHRDSILVGHSLESDLLSLKLVHSKVVDTSVVFPHRLGPPYKRALRTLTAEFLKKIIQDDEAGHDSHEDAKSSLELMLYKAKEDLKKKERNKR